MRINQKENKINEKAPMNKLRKKLGIAKYIYD